MAREKNNAASGGFDGFDGSNLSPKMIRVIEAIKAQTGRVPTKYQIAIFQWMVEGTGHAVVNAVAGSGKTTTLHDGCYAISIAIGNLITLLLAFNKAIAVELGNKIRFSHCTSKTLNGLGFGILARNSKTSIVMDDDKTIKIAKQLINFDSLTGKKEQEFLAMLPAIKKLVALFKGFGYGAIRPMPTNEDVNELCDRYDIDLPDDVDYQLFFDILIQTFEKGIKETRIYDFNDQLYMPIKLNLPFPTYNKFILIDESQDLNAINMEMIKRLAARGARCLFVGDRCQPHGTLISMAGGEIKRIEDIKVGDYVVSYNSSDRTFIQKGRRVNGITRKMYYQDIVEVNTGNKKSSYTLNHHCYANFSPLRKHYCVYLMGRGEQFRIGKCRMDYGHSSGLSSRMRAENADSAWILDVYETQSEAIAMEHAIAGKFGIPQLMFTESNVSSVMKKELLDKAWNLIGVNEDRAIECLSYFGRDPAYPLFSRHDRKFSKQWTIKRPMVVRACNLINGCSMLEYHGKSVLEREHWKQITVQRKKHTGYVYSMEIDQNHLYVGDGIVTHNCQAIYGFRGADPEAIDTVIKDFKAVEMPLSICFRCPKAVVREAQRIVPHIEYAETAKEGRVETIKEEEMFMNIKQGNFILCRTVAPLAETCMQLIREGKKATIKGSDIGTSLCSTLDKIGKSKEGKGCATVWEKINAWGDKEIAKLNKPGQENKVSRMMDRVATLLVLAEDCESIKEVKDKILRIFSDNVVGIMLSSIHRAKGLETDNVYILHPELLPHPMAKKVWAKEQEKNLEYVAITRAMDSLFWVTPENPIKFGKKKNVEPMMV